MMQNFVAMSLVALAEATQMAEATPGQMVVQFLMTFGLPILMLGGLYFLMIRPQRKEQKKRQQDRAAMKVGDNVVTIGGIVGRIVNLKDNDVTISTSVANTMMTFRKEAIDQVIKPVSDDN